MTEQQKHADDLAHCIRHDRSGEIHQHEARIAHTQGEQRCLRRAMWLMALLVALGGAGVVYSMVLMKEIAPYYSSIVVHLFTILSVGSLISLLGFAILWTVRVRKLEGQREESRCLVLKLLAASQGNPAVVLPTEMPQPAPTPGAV